MFVIYAMAIFAVFTIVLLPVVAVASFFGKVKGGNFIYKICTVWADINLALCGIFHKNIYAFPHDKTRQYVFVANHISYMDIPVMLMSVRKQHFRVLANVETSKIPLFGYIYKSAAVMVDRSSSVNRAKSILQLKSIIQKGISVLIFPEGTFNSTHQPLKEFYNGAFRLAIETQTPVKPILFLDTYDRLNYKSFFLLTPGRSRAVYLDEINVDGLTIKDIQLLKEKVFKIMEEQLIFYKADWITTTDI